MPHRKFAAKALLLLMGVVTVHVADAQTVATKPDALIPATCKFSRAARVVASMREQPSIAAEFRRLGIDLADVGEPFIPFDVVDKASKGLPRRQFVRAYVFDDRVIAWYYHGGVGTHFHAVELRHYRDTSERQPVLRITGAKLSGPPCVATQALLDGIRETDW